MHRYENENSTLDEQESAKGTMNDEPSALLLFYTLKECGTKDIAYFYII